MFRICIHPGAFNVFKQICERFKDYDEKLLFEGFNEMLNDDNYWSHPGAFKVINQYNQIFVDTIRESGGDNEYRNLMVATYASSSAPKQLNKFKLPQDKYRDHLILMVHNYSPAEFTNGDVEWMQTSDKLSTGNKLVAYVKTKELAPNEAQECSVTVGLKQFASYDDSGVTGHKNCFVLEGGEYKIFVGENVCDNVEAYSAALDEIAVKTCEEACAAENTIQAYDKRRRTQV